MSSLTEAAEAMVQFLEEMMSQQRDEPLALAAVRAVGRCAFSAKKITQHRKRFVGCH